MYIQMKGSARLQISAYQLNPGFIICVMYKMYLNMHLAYLHRPQKSFNFIHVFSLFSNYLPLEKGGPFIWTNLNSLQYKNDLEFQWVYQGFKNIFWFI